MISTSQQKKHLPIVSSKEWSEQASLQTASLSERWRKMTAWVAEGDNVVVYPTIPTTSPLEHLVEEVKCLKNLVENWDDEGAPCLDTACILNALKFAQWLIKNTSGKEIAESGTPMVFPTQEGGVKFLWKSATERRSLVFHPNQKEIECHIKRQGEPLYRKILTDAEASDFASEATLAQS